MKKIKSISAIILMLCVLMGTLSVYVPAVAVTAPFQAYYEGEQLNVSVSGSESCDSGDIDVYVVDVIETMKTVNIKGLGGTYILKNCNWDDCLEASANQSLDVLPEGEYYHIEASGSVNVWAHIYFNIVPSNAPINIKASVQNHNLFYFTPKKDFEVKPGLASEYGYEYGENVKNSDITALDALVATHLEIYGECSTEYLVLSSSGFISKVFDEETYNFGFTVNGKTPCTDEWNDAYQSYIAYTVNNCVLSENDEVEFFVYQDSTAYDKYTWFESNSNKISFLNANTNTPVSLKLRGYCIGWYGATKPEKIELMTENISGANIALVDENSNITPIEGAVTDENGNINLNFDKAGIYTVSAVSTNESGFIIMPIVTVNVTEKSELPNTDYTIENTIGVPDDWENDLWLQYDFKELKTGEQAVIYPRRVSQIISNSITNDVFRPQFNFEIISGDSVSLSNTKTDNKTTVTAVKSGVSIVKVTYDEATYKSVTYGASSKVNTAYIVYDVNNNPADVTVNSKALEKITSYDTVYFTNSDTTTLDIEPEIVANNGEIAEILVTCNGNKITKNNDNKYTLPLFNSSNIIGISVKTTDDKIKNYYKVIDARKVEIKIKNTTGDDKNIKINDKVEISFKGISNPVAKLAGFYNPTWYSEAFGNKGTYVHFENNKLGILKGYCGQWDLATKNTITVTFNEKGKYDFNNGKIFSQWWGQQLGKDKTVETMPDDTNAPQYEGEFSVLPDFSITVNDETSDNVPVSGISLNKTEATMKKGESFSLNASVLPENATNKNIIWKSSNTYFATVSNNGVVTAVNANTDKVPNVVITATSEDGEFTQKCVVVITEEAVSTGGTQNGDKTDITPENNNQPNNNTGNITNSAADILSEKIAAAEQYLPTDISKISEYSINTVISIYNEYMSLSDEEQNKVKGYSNILKAIDVIKEANHNSIYGVSLENAKWNIKLECKPMGADIGAIDEFKSKIKENVKMIAAFEISVTDILTNKAPSDNDSYTLCFDANMLKGFEGYLIVHRKADNTLEYLEPEIKGNTARVTVSSFSSYAVAGYNGSSPTDLVIPEKEKNNSIIIPIIFISVGICVIIALTAIIIINKRKKREL